MAKLPGEIIVKLDYDQLKMILDKAQEQTPKINVGKFQISELDEESLWITKTNSDNKKECVPVKISEIEKIIALYYDCCCYESTD